MMNTEAKVNFRKRIILTGASGYLGQHLLHKWMFQASDNDDDAEVQDFSFFIPNDEQWEIFALYSSMAGFEKLIEETVVSAAASQNSSHRRRRVNVQVIVESMDVTQSSTVLRDWIVSHLPLDVCIHTAAISNPGVCEEQPELAHAINVPKHFLQSLADHHVPVVALSTDQVFDGTKPLRKSSEGVSLQFYTETDTPNPLNAYGTSKVSMEEFLQLACPHSHVSLRSSIILGPLAPFGKAHSTFLHFCSSRQDQDTDFFTDECRTVVSIRNVLQVLHFFAQHPPNATTSGVYHMGGRDRVSRYDMARATFEHLGFDTQYLKPTLKAELPPGKVQSPLDISMDSSKLAKLLKVESWLGIHDIVRDTFPKEVKEE